MLYIIILIIGVQCVFAVGVDATNAVQKERMYLAVHLDLYAKRSHT